MTPYTFNGHLIKPLHDEPRGQWNPSILTSRAVAPFHTETCLWICNRLGKFYVKTCIVLQKSNHHQHNNWFCSRQINCITLLIRLKSTNDIYNKPFETTKEMRNIWSKCNILRPKNPTLSETYAKHYCILQILLQYIWFWFAFDENCLACCLLVQAGRRVGRPWLVQIMSVRRQPISWTNADVFGNSTPTAQLQWNLYQN